MTESPATAEELAAVDTERKRIRLAVQQKRVNALRMIAKLQPDQRHLAPQIARAALRRDVP
jgi:hypothetical protein